MRWRRRRKWREGDWPRGIRISKPGTGRSAGKTCNKSWDGYGRQRKGIRSILILNSACAFLPKAGAQCGSPARWDLSGGRRVTGVPTGIIVKNCMISQLCPELCYSQYTCTAMIFGFHSRSQSISHPLYLSRSSHILWFL